MARLETFQIRKIYLRITEKRHLCTLNTRASYINRICFLTSQRQFWRNFQSIVSFQCPILEFHCKKKNLLPYILTVSYQFLSN